MIYCLRKRWENAVWKKFTESLIEFEIKAICDKYIQQFNFGLVGKFRIFLKSFSKCCYSRLTYVWVEDAPCRFCKKKAFKGV